jgi:hypothetical protein
MLIKVTAANYISGFQIELIFNDGLKRVIDFKEYLDGPIFEPLKDSAYFKTFTLNRWTIEWDNGADFAPEFLHEIALEQDKEAHNTKV